MATPSKPKCYTLHGVGFRHALQLHAERVRQHQRWKSLDISWSVPTSPRYIPFPPPYIVLCLGSILSHSGLISDMKQERARLPQSRSSQMSVVGRWCSKCWSITPVVKVQTLISVMGSKMRWKRFKTPVQLNMSWLVWWADRNATQGNLISKKDKMHCPPRREEG